MASLRATWKPRFKKMTVKAYVSLKLFFQEFPFFVPKLTEDATRRKFQL